MVKNKRAQAAFQRRVGVEAKKLMEAVLKEAPAQVGTDDEEGFRQITGAKVDRDLPEVTQFRMLQLSTWFYDRDLLAKRIIDLKKDFLVGEGITVESEGETEKIIGKFWHDPLNNMDLFHQDMARDLGVLGEQAYPTFVNKQNGHVRLGYLDPYAIDSVITNPGNCRETIGLKIKSDYGMVVEDNVFVKEWRANQGIPEVKNEKNYLSVIGLDRNVNHKDTYGKLVGETFFFAINKVTNARRGKSDLLVLFDWLHNYERFLFSRVERARHLNAFIWDVLLKGMNDAQIKKWLKEHGAAPKPGSMRAHNEKVEWEAVTPKLESNDASNEARMFRSHIAGGAGIPIFWLGGGEGLTRAVALEMSTPVFKHLKSRQLYLKYMFHTIINYVLDQAIIAGWKGKIDKKFNVKFPALSQKDLVSLSQTLSGTANALVLAKDAGLITKDEASKHLKFLLKLLGGDVTVPASSPGHEPDEGVTEEDFVNDEALAKKLK